MIIIIEMTSGTELNPLYLHSYAVVTCSYEQIGNLILTMLKLSYSNFVIRK